jgi:hypothetical protein
MAASLPDAFGDARRDREANGPIAVGLFKGHFVAKRPSTSFHEKAKDNSAIRPSQRKGVRVWRVRSAEGGAVQGMRAVGGVADGPAGTPQRAFKPARAWHAGRAPAAPPTPRCTGAGPREGEWRGRGARGGVEAAGRASASFPVVCSVCPAV